MSYPLSVLLDPTTPACELTFAAEELGATRTPEVLDALLTLASHADALVREGVVYGLANYLVGEKVRAVLLRIALDDPSPGVRAAAAEALES